MSDRAVDKKKPGIEDQIEQLGALSRTELVELWIKQFKCNPPKGIKRGLLERAAGHQLQIKRSGKLKPATQRTLHAIASGGESQRLVLSPSQRSNPDPDWCANGMAKAIK